jgi:hypothetical protein
VAVETSVWEVECQIEEGDDWERRGEDGEKKTKETSFLEQCHIFHMKVVKITAVKWHKKREFQGIIFLEVKKFVKFVSCVNA